MKISLTKCFILLLPILPGLAGCLGGQTFTTAARPGDTVTMVVGRQKNLLRQNITVTITPPSGTGSPVIYAPNDTRVRSVYNLYPDPASKLVVGKKTGKGLGVNAVGIGNEINSWKIADLDEDWWQTAIMLDLPNPFPTGTASITISDAAGAYIPPVYVDVLAGSGTSNTFNVYTLSPYGGYYIGSVLSSYPKALESMERAQHHTVNFMDCSTRDYENNCIGSTIPHSIQVEFSRTVDAAVPWVVNPRGDIKNIHWTDLGNGALRVMLTTVKGTTPQFLNSSNPRYIPDFKFYLAGGLTGVTVTGVKAYDINGNPISNITPDIKQNF